MFVFIEPDDTDTETVLLTFVVILSVIVFFIVGFYLWWVHSNIHQNIYYFLECQKEKDKWYKKSQADQGRIQDFP